MAKTQMLTTDAARQQIWVDKFFRDTMVATYFSKLLGFEAVTDLLDGKWINNYENSPNEILQVKVDLEAKGETKKRRGDKITFDKIRRIDPKTYRGVTGSQVLEGKEVPLEWSTFDTVLQRYRQAFSAAEPLSWHRASFNIPESTRSQMMVWAVEMLQLLCFEALATSPTTIFYNDAGSIKLTGTAATAKSALTLANSKITPELLSFAKAWALTGGDRASNQQPIQPVMIEGKPYLVYLTHRDALYDWFRNSEIVQSSREALARGPDNPLFKGADWFYDGILIHTHEYVTKGTDAGAGSVPWTYGHLLGAQSLLMSVGERPDIYEYRRDAGEDLFYRIAFTTKIEKPVFDSLDFGSVHLMTARTNISNATKV